MKALDEKLSRLDSYFKEKKESEKWLIILGVSGIIGYLAYSQFLPIAEERYEIKKTDKKVLQVSIKHSEDYLKSITKLGDRDFYIKNYDKDIKNEKELLSTYISKSVKIDKNLEKLSNMLFNKENWSEFLHSLTKDANEEGVDIKYLNNKYVDSYGNFGHVLEISLGCKGNYKSITKFINKIEQNTLVTDVYGSNLKLEKNSSQIFADINISVWGINH